MGQSSQQPRSEMTLGELPFARGLRHATIEFIFMMTRASPGCISLYLITSECRRSLWRSAARWAA
jgi:hypothetical protein